MLECFIIDSALASNLDESVICSDSSDNESSEDSVGTSGFSDE